MGNCVRKLSKSTNTRANEPPQSSVKPSSTSTTGKLSSLSSSILENSTDSGGRTEEEMLDSHKFLEAPSLKVFTFTELKSATRNFKPETVLGVGGFGTVFKGWVEEKTLSPSKSGVGMVIAVKKLNPESVQGFEEWQSEVRFLGMLSHPNLVKLMGYCWENRELLLVYEFMPKGSLENHLFRRGAAFEPLSWSLRLKIAIGAARGLAFLHSANQKIIYRDFKASNILLDSDYSAKLSDFGLAKNGPLGSNSHVTTRVMGTEGYAAPEYVSTGHLYVKSDVYGFGVVLLEMLSGQRALDTARPSGQHKLVDWAKPYISCRKRIARLMDPRLGGQYSSKSAFQAAELVLRCIAEDPKNRPSMKEVLETLELIDTTKSRPSESRHVGGSISGASMHPPSSPIPQRPRGGSGADARAIIPRSPKLR